MIDIISANDGEDLKFADTQVPKAANILSTQLRSLEYLKDFGIDLDYFLQSQFLFQNESFKAYTIEVLTNNGINVASVVETIERLLIDYEYNLAPVEASSSLIAR